jgi:hypothetical protein
VCTLQVVATSTLSLNDKAALFTQALEVRPWTMDPRAH